MRSLSLTLIIVLAVSSINVVHAQQFRTHTVQSGDTLYRIARTHLVTVESLRSLNDIVGDHIEPGQTIWIDGKPEEPSNESLLTEEEQALVDSLLAISEAALEPAVNDSTLVSTATPGNAISVPEPDIAQTDSIVAPADGNGMLLSEKANLANNPVEQSTEMIPHVVLPSETIYTIAKRYGVSADTVAARNPAHETFLAAGDTIYVPWGGQLGKHRVKAGETLFRISREYGTSVEHIRELNDITGNNITTGMNLIVPLRPEDVASQVRQSQTILGKGKVRIYPEVFEGRLMANGKPYIADRFTISHSSIELGTHVVLVDHESGNQTFAEVTDRLPAGSGVAMEISQAVADVLQLANEDSEVEIRAVK